MKDNNETAIHSSDSIFVQYKKLQEKPEIKQEITKNERIARLAESDDWKAIVEIIDAYIEQLTSLRSITENDTLEAVGARVMASQVAIEYLKDIKDFPNRAKKIIEGKK